MLGVAVNRGRQVGLSGHSEDRHPEGEEMLEHPACEFHGHGLDSTPDHFLTASHGGPAG